jgi:2-polyprenyl-3-methyl-5-hydroxy-6-metoxy-1,4-benzoquinol methylase
MAEVRYQLSAEAAEFYETTFVPALFAAWARRLVDTVALTPGQAVLDVACGTGVVARTAADLAGDAGAVVGLDLNEGDARGRPPNPAGPALAARRRLRAAVRR